MTDATEPDKIEASLKDKLKYANIVLGVLALVIWFFGRTIIDVVNDFNHVKAIPSIVKDVDKLKDEMKTVDERSRVNREDVKEIQQKVLPRVPAWQVEVKRGGS